MDKIKAFIDKYKCEMTAAMLLDLADAVRGNHSKSIQSDKVMVSYVLSDTDERNLCDWGVLIGARIRELRKSRGVSQRSIQKKLNKYESWLCGVENGTVQLYAKDIPGLADALGVSIADIYHID